MNADQSTRITKAALFYLRSLIRVHLRLSAAQIVLWRFHRRTAGSSAVVARERQDQNQRQNECLTSDPACRTCTKESGYEKVGLLLSLQSLNAAIRRLDEDWAAPSAHPALNSTHKFLGRTKNDSLSHAGIRISGAGRIGSAAQEKSPAPARIPPRNGSGWHCGNSIC